MFNQDIYIYILIYVLIFALVWRDRKAKVYILSSMLITGNFVFSIWQIINYGIALDDGSIVGNSQLTSIVVWSNILVAGVLFLIYLFKAIKKEWE
ncbi:hypothetical protein [Listeria cornellensis]|uniref:Uncharacterized protein n=1 Tax=Listeria cornellensis FSL F6-0969 TaxID=1265820 RepID=W7CIT9_9LIST|nr:hypothetical protein [Listeria cornellensis]EUJ32893.1 hypothetical protein PCORN_00360 [Listeria cornellensis FSL F6-0969]